MEVENDTNDDCSQQGVLNYVKDISDTSASKVCILEKEYFCSYNIFLIQVVTG